MRWLRRLLHAFLVVFMLLVGAATAAAIVTQTAWFKNRVRIFVVSQAGSYLNGDISIKKLSGNFVTGFELEQIAITVDGKPILSIQDIGVDYNVIQLIAHGVSIDRIRLNRPVLHVRHDGSGWSLANLVKKQEREADRRGPELPIAIDEIGISDGAAVIDDEAGTPGVRIPNRIDRVDARFSFQYAPVHYSIDIAHLSFRASEPELALNSLSGGIALRDDELFLESVALRTPETSLTIQGAIKQYLTSPVFNLRISSDKTSISELSQVVPSLSTIHVQPAYELTLNGPLDRLGVDMNLQSSAGTLTGTLTADLEKPLQSVSGNVSVRHLDLAPIVDDRRQSSDITAEAKIDLRAESLSDLDSMAGTVKVAAPRIVAAGYKAEGVKAIATAKGRRIDLTASGRAYGSSLTTSGRVTLPQEKGPVAFDLRGRTQHLDLRKLPRSLDLPSANTEVNASYHVVGTALVSGRRSARPKLVLDAAFENSVVPGATILPGTTAMIDTREDELSYSADAQLKELDLQRVGDAFGIRALADDRYKSRIDGHVVMAGRGTTVAAMDLTARGNISEAALFAGRLAQTDFEASLADDTAHVKAVGTFADLDPAVLTNKPELQGTAGGRLDADTTIEGVSNGVTLDSVSGTVRLTLEPSMVGGLAVQSASLDADYRARTGQIRHLEIVGPDVTASAEGTLALGESGQSDLAFHAQSPRLNEITALLDVPVSGIGQVDGTVTGNGTELQAVGTLAGSGVAYQDNGALTVKSSYTVRVPDLDFKRASAIADTQGTFVKLAGQEINEVSAKTTYDEGVLTFEATAKQPARSLDAAGSLLFHPDHQEVHLQKLTLAASNQEWTVPQGTSPVINYAHETIAVEGLRLTSADQEIVTEGEFGRAGSSLNVSLNNVELARVDELLLRPPQFTGRLNATAHIEGTRERPTVSGQFEVAKGGFRQFTYDSLTGTLNYEPQGMTLDARLQQNAEQWITAKGYLPTALFARRKEEASGERGHVEPAQASDRVDLTIDSSPLGLGLLQGFTTEVSDVQGTVEAHIKVTGAAEDPHPTGTLTVADGMMTVVSTGVPYSHIAGRVDLEPDRVHIDQLTVLDNHQSALSLTGDLAVHERDVGQFHLWITAEDFKVIDNKMGNLRIQSAMELTGELRAPEIRGDFGVSTGRLNVDEILALAGPSPYSTEPIDYVGGTGPAGEAKKASLFDSLRMNVRVTVPDDLVIAARSLQAPGSSIGLGAINVTLGGDLTALKDPAGPVRLVGIVETVRGTYDFQGRRFEILRDGSIRFDGLDEFDPRLDLRTRRLIQGVEARVNVRGTMKKPEVVLSSTPPQPEAEILSLIVFNQPINQLGVGQQMNLAQRAQELATGAVTGELSQSLARALNLETFELNLAPESGSGPMLTIGQQLGPNLYVKVQQGIADQTSTNLIVEYAIKNWLRLQTNVIQGASVQQSLFQRNQGTGADLIFLFTK